MAVYISASLRQQIRAADRERCCYCLTTELNSGIRLALDHVYPRSQGGATTFENVCLACRACNEFKSDTVNAIDLETGDLVRLFHPRTQVWHEHFEWVLEGTEVRGKTASGRVTVMALQMNRLAIVLSRRRWVQVGWHPPRD